MTKEQLLKENELRKVEPPYNPRTGQGAYGTRKEVNVEEFGTMWLPVDFLKIKWIKKVVEFGSVHAYCQTHDSLKGNDKEVIKRFIQTRSFYDCEYWMSTFANIKIKNKPKDDKLIPEKAQRVVLYEILDDWYAGVPVRLIIVKCRQAFITTLSAVFFMWVQLVVLKSWNSLICGDIENQATNVRGIQDKVAKNIPSIFTEKGTKFEMLPYEGSNKTRTIAQRECRFSTGSMQKPENVRSADNTLVHLTEVGLWKTTLGKTPEDLIQAIRGGMDDIEQTVFVLESSPKGTGNYFYRQWIEAKNGRSDLKPVFLPWFYVKRYSVQIRNQAQFFDAFFYGKDKDYLQYLWSAGATLEQINWYINKLKTMEHWRIQSEFPSNDVEAFQSTGSRVFTLNDVNKRRKECLPPVFVGEIYGKESKGADALVNINTEKRNSFFKIWAYPDKDENVSDRYLVVVDIGKGKSTKADFSVITVFDRYELMFGGKLEIVAEWKGKIDIDLLAWKAAQIATMYNNALYVIEKNTIDTITDYSKVLLAEINDYYDNLYCTITIDKKTEVVTKTLGFHTNSSTKPLVIETLQGGTRDDLYYERNDEACVEMDTYELKEDGKFGAADGCHDDLVMTRAIGLYVSTKMPMPKIITASNYVAKKKIVGYSSM
ncbi:MAG: hypothetical protein JZU53_06990 [Paludibacter sp.]|nr:hypothetical protein [Paludibacter sp.]